MRGTPLLLGGLGRIGLPCGGVYLRRRRTAARLRCESRGDQGRGSVPACVNRWRNVLPNSGASGVPLSRHATHPEGPSSGSVAVPRTGNGRRPPVQPDARAASQPARRPRPTPPPPTTTTRAADVRSRDHSARGTPRRHRAPGNAVASARRRTPPSPAAWHCPTRRAQPTEETRDPVRPAVLGPNRPAVIARTPWCSVGVRRSPG